MKISTLSLMVGVLFAWAGARPAQALTLQNPANVIGTGTNAWSYLILEGENYEAETDATPSFGFTRAFADGTVPLLSAYENPVLATNTTASKLGALWTQPAPKHGDKVTYRVQFSHPGTYYLYMRFTMFENGGNPAHYLNEDSFFVPPDWGKDPQTDWPLSDAGGQNGGYTEGCCDGAGYLFIPEKGGGGLRVSHSADTNYWEGNFHWNDLYSSQFLNATTQGEPKVRRKYEVPPALVGRPLTFTISNRENGTAIDLFLFSTHPDLMDKYAQEELDQLLLKPGKVTVQDPHNVVGTGNNAWSYLILEGENYAAETDATPGFGFTRAFADGTVPALSFYENPVLATNTTASGKGALWMQPAPKHGDKVNYQVQFAHPGTYYLYMRFTMFENGSNPAHYLNEDSFFVPPNWGKDPQTDWPLSDAGGQNGGYTEGCCDGAGYLFIPEKGGGGVRVSHSADTNYWEGNFHWNDLYSSQFLNATTQGEPKVRRKYEVTPDQVGKPLTFTLSNRENGTAIDLFLFSTHPDLMNTYSHDELDQLFLTPPGQLSIQDPAKTVGSGADAWTYLAVEGESYFAETNEAEGVGFTRAYVDGTVPALSAYGNPVLATNSTASGYGALWTQPAAKHGDKVTYRMQFAKPGTYYLYMRFTMFENGSNPAHYLNEDSFFVPPDWGKDPQTDWPLSDAGGQNGGYTEGCCDGAGYLFIPEKGGSGLRVSHSADTNYWEGNFHWNDLYSSQFLNAETQGAPKVRRKYEVTAEMVGHPLTWTISNRENGTAVDLWLFSTHPDLMDKYSQEELDAIILAPAATAPGTVALSISRSGNNVLISWPASADGYGLEAAGTLSAPVWTPVADVPAVAAGQKTVTVSASAGPKYYRLKHP